MQATSQTTPTLSDDGQRLLYALERATRQPTGIAGEKMHITGVADTLIFAYEQLRNVAGYTEQHLLLRVAIERFLHHNMPSKGHLPAIGEQLIAELTQARYLENDTVPKRSSKQIDELVRGYAALIPAMQQTYHVPRERATQWVRQVASVAIERLLVARPSTDAFIDFAYHHLSQAIDRGEFGEVNDHDFETALYCALHRTLLRFDIATTRSYIVAIRSARQPDLTTFVESCRAVDELFESRLTHRLSRLINRYGAPLRVIREMALSQPQAFTQTLRQRSQLVSQAYAAIEQHHTLARRRLIKGVVRATAFIFITKVLIGLAVEIPYDLITIGNVAHTPLLINLFVPSALMATAVFSIGKPNRHNTEEVAHGIERILYRTEGAALSYAMPRPSTSPQLRIVFNVVYLLMFAISFGALILVLGALHFMAIDGLIFFSFLSAVSFLRFRLLQTTRELDMTARSQTIIGALADFFYTPFVRLGYWLSDTFSRVNVVTVVLDLAIEMPLKVTLHVVREWVGFIRDKRAEL